MTLCGVCVCIYSPVKNKTASFIGWNGQTKTAVRPYVEQITTSGEVIPGYLTLSFLHFEIGNVQDTYGRAVGIDGMNFQDSHIKGSVSVVYKTSGDLRSTYSFVNCSWLPPSSNSSFSSTSIEVDGANLIVESSQLTGVDFSYHYHLTSLVKYSIPCFLLRLTHL